ncbi:MAG: hypothetical protein R3321_08545, partial [Nitrososphaeraceae archaeon]|nr:hypothetical protein [Nitrososphaeraceae archaeon]
MVNKLTDALVGDFTIKSDNKNIQALIDDFIHSTNFNIILRDWIKEAIGKGNGFIEIDALNSKIRIMNANNMYVKRNKKGEVLEYNQYKGELKNFNKDSKKLISFTPNQIAHLTLNKMPNDPYGIGWVYPNERVVENLVLLEQDLQKIMSRKANSPYHIKIGQPGEIGNAGAIDQMASDLQYMNNLTNWVTDGNVQIDVIQLNELGKSILEALAHNYRMLLAGMEVPEVMMGSGQLNEGIAKIQDKTFTRKINSVRAQIETVIEEKIFRPFLLNQSPTFDEKIQFIWEEQSEEEKTKKIEQISNLLNNFGISENMKRALQIELARLMGFEDLENMLIKPEKGADEEREEEENIEQPEVPGAKPNANQKLQEFIRKKGSEYCVYSEKGKNLGCYKTKAAAQKRLGQIEFFKKHKAHADMTIKEFINLKEIEGFNYTDYLIKILEILRNDPFVDLKAITEADITAGLLPERDIKKLRTILKKGFRENQTIKEIENELDKSIKFKDRKIGSKIVL